MNKATLKADIRQQIHGELGEDVQVRFVEDANRMDVRVTGLGIAERLEQQDDALSVTTYSDYRFTITVE